MAVVWRPLSWPHVSEFEFHLSHISLPLSLLDELGFLLLKCLLISHFIPLLHFTNHGELEHVQAAVLVRSRLPEGPATSLSKTMFMTPVNTKICFFFSFTCKISTQHFCKTCSLEKKKKKTYFTLFIDKKHNLLKTITLERSWVRVPHDKGILEICWEVVPLD